MIHLINPLSALGGSELRTLELCRLLSSRDEVMVWSEGAILPAVAARAHPGARLVSVDAAEGRLPRGGTVVFVGSYFVPGWWIRQVEPRRVVVIHNLLDTRGLLLLLLRLRQVRWPAAELVFCSRLAAQHLADHLRRLGSWAEEIVPGWERLTDNPRVHISPIDLQRLRPRPASDRPRGPLRLGRHSRDQLIKHHPGDADVYRLARRQGWEIRLLGGRCLAPVLRPDEGIDLLPAGAENPADFLPALDLFFYRTAPQWTEPSARAVLEAMACGLPVLCERRGGHCDHIRPGDQGNGLLFDEDSEASQLIAALAADPLRRKRLGDAARASAEALCGGARLESELDFYVA